MSAETIIYYPGYEAPEFSLEDATLPSLAGVFKFKVKLLQGLLNKVSLVQPHVLNLYIATDRIKKIGMGTVGEFHVLVPEGVIGEIVPYLGTLRRAMSDLANIESRIIKPLQNWAGNVVADPRFLEKVWFSDNITMVDTKPIITALSKHYDNRVGDDLRGIRLIDVYPEIDDLEKAGGIIDELNTKATAVLDSELADAAQVTGDLLIDAVSELKRVDGEDPKVISVMKRVKEITYAAASEIELTSVLLFQIMVAAEAHNQTLAKIREQL